MLLLAMFIALVFGLVLVACANSDFPQSRLRKWGLTKETSYPTEWLSAFTGDDKRWVILNLADKHRLMGQLDEWPNYPDAGHFVLINPTWVDEDGQPSPQKEIYKILVPVKDVGIVEFVKHHEEQEPPPSPPSNTAAPAGCGIPSAGTAVVVAMSSTAPDIQPAVDGSKPPTTKIKDGPDVAEKV